MNQPLTNEQNDRIKKDIRNAKAREKSKSKTKEQRDKRNTNDRTKYDSRTTEQKEQDSLQRKRNYDSRTTEQKEQEILQRKRNYDKRTADEIEESLQKRKVHNLTPAQSASKQQRNSLRQLNADIRQGRDRSGAGENIQAAFHGNYEDQEFLGDDNFNHDDDDDEDDYDTSTHNVEMSDASKEKRDVTNFCKYMDKSSELRLCFVCHEEHSALDIKTAALGQPQIPVVLMRVDEEFWYAPSYGFEIAPPINAPGNMDRVIAVNPIKSIYNVKLKFPNGEKTVSRIQLPLIVAFALTIHKSQGLNKQFVLFVASSKLFERALSYVALSRCTTLDGLSIVGCKVSTKHFKQTFGNQHENIKNETRRLRKFQGNTLREGLKASCLYEGTCYDDDMIIEFTDNELEYDNS